MVLSFGSYREVIWIGREIIMDDNAFYVTFGWMRNRLGLDGFELDAYAVIYGFTQDGTTYYHGGLKYLMDVLGCSKSTMLRTLNSLVEKDIIKKYTNIINNVTYANYCVNYDLLRFLNRGWCQNETTGVKNELGVVSKSSEGGVKMKPNNKDNNKINNNKNIKEIDSNTIYQEKLCISGSLPYEISTGIPEVDQRYTNGLPEVNPDKDSIGKDSIYISSSNEIRKKHLPSRENGFASEGKPIPDINTDNNNTDNKEIYKSSLNSDLYKESKEESQSISNWKAKEKDMSDVGSTTCPKEQYKQNVYSEVQNSYNTICTSLPRCTLISEKRKKAINAILGQFSMEQVTEALKKVQASDFLSGRSGAWQCSFDWLMITGNMLKVIEGNYDNKKNSRSDLGEREFTLTSREAKLSTDREFVLR